MLTEEEVVVELEVKMRVVVREEVSVNRVVVLRPPDVGGNFELTLPSPLTPILQMGKLRPPRVLGFCCNPGSDGRQIQVPGSSPRAQPSGLRQGHQCP